MEDVKGVVNGTVDQNTLPGVLRISCVFEPISRRYLQTVSLLRSDSVRSTYISLNRFPCRSDFSSEKNAKSNSTRSSEYGSRCILIFHSSFSLRESLESSVHLTMLYTCRPLNMNLNVSMGIIFADTQNLMALRMSFDDVTPVFFPNSYHDHCATSDISNINQATKEHQTSTERRHELVIMSFDVCKSLTPICIFFCLPNQKVEILSFTSFSKWGPPQGFWGSGEKGYLFSGSWGALLIILGELGSKHILLRI